jgi:hypothetical protein
VLRDQAASDIRWSPDGTQLLLGFDERAPVLDSMPYRDRYNRISVPPSAVRASTR